MGTIVLNQPRTTDNKTYTRSSAYTLGTRLYIAGCGDHRTNGVGKGSRFELEHSTSGLSSWYEWQFNDWVELGGGGMWYKNAVFGDYIAFRLYAPATEVVANAGAGNCNIVSNVLVPAAGNGSHDVDLETSDKFVPLIVPGTGYWNWDYPDTGRGECTAAPSGNGNCNLLNIDYPIHTYVADVPLLGDNELNVTFPGVDPTRFLPQWKMGVRLYNNGGGHNIQLVWEMEIARMNGAVIYA